MTDTTNHSTGDIDMSTSTNENEYSREVLDRIDKVKELRKLGDNPYKERYDIDSKAGDLAKTDPSKLPNAEKIVKNVKPKHSIAGRVMIMRTHGKLSFATLKDQSGALQVCFMQDILGIDQYKHAIKFIDRGDFIGVKGDLFVTNHGETTLLISEYELLSKTIRPLPEKWHGLSDQETKYRKRYLDTISDDETFRRFIFRSNFISFIRNYLVENDFLEIETPILSNSASGALAKPFITHHNALDHDFYLRIAPETALKKAVAGGYERVFEFAKCFRNEGIDPSHLQEFTMLEYYASYWNYEDNMKFTEQMMEYVTKSLFGSTKVKFRGSEFDFKAPYPRHSIRDLIFKDSGIDIDKLSTADALRAEISKKGIKLEGIADLARGNLIDTLYKKVSRPSIKNPMFLIHHPTDLSPLARRNDDNPNITDRFQLVVNGWEVVNAYSELIDPIDQRERFEQQADAKAGGDEEAMMFDHAFLESMEHGMPPMSGWGMGIDRIVSLFTDQDNLKDVVMFPLLRPDKNEANNKKPNNETQSRTTLHADKKVSTADNPVMTSKNIDLKPGFTRDQVLPLIDKYVDPALQPHLFFVEAAMRRLANHYGHSSQVDSWGLAGLCHDIDWSITESKCTATDTKAHCGEDLEKILGEVNATSEFIEAIRSHHPAYEFDLDSDLKKALYAVDELCGLIVACTLVRPSKKMAEVEVKSIKKKFKDKGFAAKVDRSLVLTCETNLNTPIDEFIQLALEAMQEIAGEYGL